MKTNFGFIGWCHEENHDKIWGYIYRPTPGYDEDVKKYGFTRYGTPMRNVVIFWAARGKAMQFKADVANDVLNRLEANKQYKKHYQPITEAKLLEIWPTFNDEMQMKLSFEILVGNVK